MGRERPVRTDSTSITGFMGSCPIISIAIMSSDVDEDNELHSSSFLRPPPAEMADDAGNNALTAAEADARPAERSGGVSDAGEATPEEDDEDERPREVPRERILSANPFAAPEVPPQSASASSVQSIGVTATPFAQPHSHQPPVLGPQPEDEYLRVSDKCTARHCFRLQWEAEMNPRCREKTALNVENKIYLFDGFYMLCHDETPDIPQFEYTRGGVMCRIRFVREPLPQTLLPPSEPGNPSITSIEGCHTIFQLKHYLFQQLLGIQPMHLFQAVFGDPSRATGDVSDYCSDFHLIPRFISVSDAPLLNKEDLLAPHRIGFAVGKFLPINHVLGCLDASAKYPVAAFLETSSPRALVDSIISTRINGVPGVYRVDGLVYEELNVHAGEADMSTLPDPSKVPAKPMLRHLKHCGQGAVEYDGITSKKKLRKWQELGRLVQVSPRVDPHIELLNPFECHLTGLRADVFELGSAIPMVLKYVRHYKLLASFERDMKIPFKEKTLLRQAFTHGSYVDVAMQSVNTVEATISRVRLGHIFENTGMLKRDRSTFLEEQSSNRTGVKMDAEVKRVAEQHLTSDFRPEFHTKYLCPYERLEFLGDAVLSFLVASSSFLKLPHTDGEDVLHETRKLIANNAALGRVARAANFDVLMLTAYDLRQLPEKDTTKIAADCMEALLGAVYKDQGIDACRALLLELMNRHAPDVCDLYLLDKSSLVEAAKQYVATDRDRFREWERERETRKTHLKFSTSTNVVIHNTHLWLQALTHNSFKSPQIDDGEFVCTDPSYERIEFLGDAVLQLLSSEFLVEALPNYQEHLLTQARSSLVKNTRLAIVARNAGYEEFIRLGREVKKNGNLYMDDVLADVFEATLGAVFLENPTNLAKVRAILEENLFPLLKEAIRRREWMNPEKVLMHYINEWSRGQRKVECAFRKLQSRNDNEHSIAVYINRFRVASGSGRTIQEAKNRACKQALYLYGVGLAK